MAGLLDFLGGSSGGGGLLDFLRNNALQQQPLGGLSSDQAQYGAAPSLFSPPMQANAQMQQPVLPPSPQSAPAPLPSPPSSTGSFGTGFLNNLQAGPIGALIGGIGTAAGLEDPSLAAQRYQAALDARSLRSHGVAEPDIAAAVGNGRVPGNKELLKALITNNVKEKEQYRAATPQERAAAGLTGDINNTPMFINTATGEPKFGPPQTNVNVSTEKTGQAELATKGVQAYIDAQNAGRDAQRRISQYDVMQKAAEGFTPGATAEMRLAAKRYLKDAGLIKGEDVPDGEIMQMISRQLGVHAQPKGQGAVSNYERELFAKSLPNMSQSPEGLKMAIDISRRLEQFDQKVADIYRQSARENKGLPNYLDVQDKIAALGSPLSDSQMMTIQNPQSAPASPPPASGGAKWQDIGGGIRIRPKQ